jgi:hypothetical protein
MTHLLNGTKILRVSCDLDLEERSTELVSKERWCFALLTMYSCGDHSQQIVRKWAKKIKKG